MTTEVTMTRGNIGVAFAGAVLIAALAGGPPDAQSAPQAQAQAPAAMDLNEPYVLEAQIACKPEIEREWKKPINWNTKGWGSIWSERTETGSTIDFGGQAAESQGRVVSYRVTYDKNRRTCVVRSVRPGTLSPQRSGV
jgi:hypothetical protein